MPIGGQAVLEGVMLQDGERVVLAVRTPEGRVTLERLPLRVSVPALERLPLLRGSVRLVQMLALGWAALQRSAELAYPEERTGSCWEGIGVLLLAVLFVVGGFIVLPAYLAGFLGIGSRLLLNLAEGGIRVLLFVGYLGAISLLPDVRRVFQYHGAEHKVVHAHEEGEASLERARARSPVHPRCGTSFLLLFILVAILVFSLVPTPNLGVRLLARVLLLPVVAGITYELLRLAGRRPHAGWLRPLVLPGLLLQRLTTREPTDDQVEVALAALRYLTEGESSRSLSTTS